MKIYVLIPVHNRVELTQKCVLDLVAQDFDGDIEIVVIDDGSTDGTSEQLKILSDETGHALDRQIVIINGDGDWWWTKCIEKALLLVRPKLKSEDSVLLLNDDVRLEPNYLDQLVKARDCIGMGIVMSQLVNVHNKNDRLVSPVSVSSKKLEISAVNHLEFVDSRLARSDVAPGRGTLYPAVPLIEGHTVKTKQMPQYIADYEFSARISQLGYPIVCALDAFVFTELVWGNTKGNGNIVRRLFAKESPDNLRAHWTFWRSWSPKLSWYSLLLKILRYKVLPCIFNIDTSEAESQSDKT